MSCTVVTREASSSSRWEWAHWPAARHYANRKVQTGGLHQVPPLKAWGTSWKRWRKDCRSQRGWRTPRESTKQGSHGLTETEAASTEPTLVSARLLTWHFCWTPNPGSGYDFDFFFCLLFRLFSSCWVALSSFSVTAFCLALLYLVLSYLDIVSWRPAFFLMKKWVGGVDLEEMEE